MSASTFFPLQHRAETLPAQLQKRWQVRAKRGRGKAVTWPPEDQICQIRFFLSNDVPSSIGSEQNVTQMNQLRTSPPQRSVLGLMHAPPGFHGSLVKRARVMNDSEASMTIGRPWIWPKKFVCDNEWLVADGDESKEAGLQQQRELRVLEAFYPRLTAIPDSPAEPVGACTVLHDSLIPAIPLVPIEEEDESSEHGSKIVEKMHNLDELSELGKPMENRTPDFSVPKASTTPSQEPSWHAHYSIGSADAKVAAAAAAAACMAFHKHGASDLVDPGLLVEILRNPILLKSLTLFNQSSESPAVALNGLNKPTIDGQSSQNHHQVIQYDGPHNKACTGIPLNAGLPSPVSVLSDWTQQEPAALLPTMLSNPSENCKAPKHSHNPRSTWEGVLPLESTRMHGFHARSHEGRMGNNASCIPNASVQMTSVVQPDRSCGMVAPLPPFPSQNGVDFHLKMPGRMQTAQGLSSQVGVVHHQSIPSLDSIPCISSLPEARLRGSESSGSCFMNKAGPRSTRLCMYFNTPRGCRNGGNCAFLHQSGSPELNAIAQ